MTVPVIVALIKQNAIYACINMSDSCLAQLLTMLSLMSTQSPWDTKVYNKMINGNEICYTCTTSSQSSIKSASASCFFRFPASETRNLKLACRNLFLL